MPGSALCNLNALMGEHYVMALFIKRVLFGHDVAELNCRLVEACETTYYMAM